MKIVISSLSFILCLYFISFCNTWDQNLGKFSMAWPHYLANSQVWRLSLDTSHAWSWWFYFRIASQCWLFLH